MVRKDEYPALQSLLGFSLKHLLLTWSTAQGLRAQLSYDYYRDLHRVVRQDKKKLIIDRPFQII